MAYSLVNLAMSGEIWGKGATMVLPIAGREEGFIVQLELPVPALIVAIARSDGGLFQR